MKVFPLQRRSQNWNQSSSLSDLIITSELLYICAFVHSNFNLFNLVFHRKALFVHTYRLVQYTDGWCFQVSEHLHADQLCPHTHKGKQGCYFWFPVCVCDWQNSEVSRQRFQTLETLIESYRRGVASGVSAVAPLRNPLDKTQIQSISLRQGMAQKRLCCLIGYKVFPFMSDCKNKILKNTHTRIKESLFSSHSFTGVLYRVGLHGNV